MVRPEKHIGRTDFVLWIALFTALAIVFGRLLKEGASPQLDGLPHYLGSLSQGLCCCVLGVAIANTIAGRLLNARLPRWYFWPITSIWLMATCLLVVTTGHWDLVAAPLLMILVAGGMIPSKSENSTLASETTRLKTCIKASTPIVVFPPLPRVGPISFLRCLLTIGCLCLPLILLDSLGREIGTWAARIGYFILGAVWAIKFIGRLEDAGRSPRIKHVYFVLGTALLIQMLRRLGRSSESYSLSSYGVLHVASALSSWLTLVNRYELLAAFLLIQAPLALLPSKFRPEEPSAKRKIENKWRRAENKYRKLLTERSKASKIFLVKPFSFLCRLLVIALLWVPLIYMDGASNGYVGTWIARLGYFILAYAWLMNADGRFGDAGLGFGCIGKQYALVVSVASLMPLAVHRVNGYGALAIFVLIQIPAVSLPSKAISEAGGPGARGAQ